MVGKKGDTSIVSTAEVKRRRKFTEVTKNQIIGMVKGGTGQYEAARACGVTTETLRDWRRKAAQPGGEEYGEFVEALDAAVAQLQVYGEQTVFKAGKAKQQWPRCASCDVAHREVSCNNCGEMTPINCPACARPLRIEGAGDWRAMAHWLKGQFRFKWGDKINVEVEGELRAFMAALAEEFSDTPEVFDRCLRVAMEGAGEGVDPSKR